MGNSTCPDTNTAEVDQSTFWSKGNIHWDTHRIGWVIAGACACVTVVISVISISRHALNYRVRDEQRQIIRILYMPPVYAIISFLSYRFFRDYTYYSLVEVVYESITLGAFLLLLIQYVAATGHGHSAEAALARKDKEPLPFPLCCWRYRPIKPGFMHAVKWSVLQYTIVRPAISIAGIICQAYDVLCEESWNYRHASVYLTAIDFVSITVSLYGLLLFYGLTKEELRGRRPLAKFLCIKLIVMATFYQSFVFDFLQNHGVIHATEYWTTTNIANGLNALTTCIEMIFFALGMLWAYPVTEYKTSNSQRKMSYLKAIWDSINISDFAREIYSSVKFFIDYASGRVYQRSNNGRVDFSEAFRIEASSPEANHPLHGTTEHVNMQTVIHAGAR